MVTGFQYTTMAGDTFDILALDAYNDESKANKIIEANPAYAGVLTFDAGVLLQIPYLEEQSPSSLPPWKR